MTLFKQEDGTMTLEYNEDPSCRRDEFYPPGVKLPRNVTPSSFWERPDSWRRFKEDE